MCEKERGRERLLTFIISTQRPSVVIGTITSKGIIGGAVDTDPLIAARVGTKFTGKLRAISSIPMLETPKRKRDDKRIM